ncbi:MAG: hypothetical protein HEQ22_08640 [Sphingopyxis sp.]|uniref:hypothetical protein n=1 Tax=Sphingopyxis sp. TaxID=1908224 RepID=UPI003D80B652
MCDRLRKGFYFTDATKVRATVKFCTFRTSQNAKRWAVNGLSELGYSSDVDAALALAPQANEDPDLMAAIVGAVYASRPEDEASALLEQAGIPPTGLSLIASARFSHSQKTKLVQTLIPLEASNSAELRAAIVLAGTDHAPQHMFHRKFTNAISLGQLNQHDVPSVSKYSIWAITQLDLGFSCLTLPIADIEGCAPEVRKWMFRLLFRDATSLQKHLEMIDVARKDGSREVREEAAIGLRETFVNGIENRVIEWFFREDHDETKNALLDHMAAHCSQSEQYKSIVLDFYRSSGFKSDARNRIEAASIKTDLYRELRMIEMEDEQGRLFANDNFGKGSTMVNNNQNFIGNQIGAVTGSGDINTDTLSAVAQTDEATRQILQKVLQILPRLSEEDQGVGMLLVKEIAENPGKSTWQKFLGFLSGAKKTIDATGGFAGSIDGLVGEITDLVNMG